MSSYRRKTWQEKLTDSKGLPKFGQVMGNMRRTWGSGTMVVPAPREVDEVMRRVPKGKVTTINQIRSVLAKKHKVNICCSITTGIFSPIARRLDDPKGATPLGLIASAGLTQGSSCLATLGFVAESLWDSTKPEAAKRGSAWPTSRPSDQSGDKSPHSKGCALVHAVHQ